MRKRKTPEATIVSMKLVRKILLVWSTDPRTAHYDHYAIRERLANEVRRCGLDEHRPTYTHTHEYRIAWWTHVDPSSYTKDLTAHEQQIQEYLRKHNLTLAD